VNGMSSQLSQLPPAQSRVAGEMLMVLLAATLLTLPVALSLLALCKRRLLKSMASHSAMHGTLAVTLSQPWRAAAIYSMAGISAASVLTVTQLLQHDTELLPGRFLLLTLAAMWPVVLTILLVAAATRRARATAVLAYLVGVAAIGAGELLVRPAFSWGQLTLLLLLVNFFPTLLVVIAINRKVRAVGPLVLALPAWLVLTGLGRAYERRRISDESITVDALWLVVCTVSAVGLSYDNPRWLLTAPLAFGVYKLVAWAGFTVIGPDPDAPQRRRAPPSPAPPVCEARVVRAYSPTGVIPVPPRAHRPQH
jgi:hypothetical protein